jgi:5'-nucleotidase
MRILLSNDDGYLAQGLLAMHKALSNIAEVTVFAPLHNNSGSSSSLTLQKPLNIRKISSGEQSGFNVVDGTPTDCTHLALSGLLDFTPDMVVSGINQGPNLAEDVIYSGTVAAAIEGYFLNIPSIAFSQISKSWKNIDCSAKIATEFVMNLAANLPPKGQNVLWNVNIPDVQYSSHKGFQITRLGKRHPSEPLIEQKNPRGEKVYWIGGVGAPKDISSRTDFHAVNNGYTSATPLQFDLTNYAAIEQEWIKACIPQHTSI